MKLVLNLKNNNLLLLFSAIFDRDSPTEAEGYLWLNWTSWSCFRLSSVRGNGHVFSLERMCNHYHCAQFHHDGRSHLVHA